MSSLELSFSTHMKLYSYCTRRSANAMPGREGVIVTGFILLILGNMAMVFVMDSLTSGGRSGILKWSTDKVGCIDKSELLLSKRADHWECCCYRR